MLLVVLQIELMCIFYHKHTLLDYLLLTISVGTIYLLFKSNTLSSESLNLRIKNLVIDVFKTKSSINDYFEEYDRRHNVDTITISHLLKVNDIRTSAVSGNIDRYNNIVTNAVYDNESRHHPNPFQGRRLR